MLIKVCQTCDVPDLLRKDIVIPLVREPLPIVRRIHEPGRHVPGEDLFNFGFGGGMQLILNFMLMAAFSTSPPPLLTSPPAPSPKREG